jgi:hypothetical protein
MKLRRNHSPVPLHPLRPLSRGQGCALHPRPDLCTGAQSRTHHHSLGNLFTPTQQGIVAWPVAKLLEFVLGSHHGIIYRRAGTSRICFWYYGAHPAQSSRSSSPCTRPRSNTEATSRWTLSQSSVRRLICRKRLCARYVTLLQKRRPQDQIN